MLTEHDNLAAQRLYSACGAHTADDVLLFTFRLTAGPNTAGAMIDEPSAPLPVHVRSAAPADAESFRKRLAAAGDPRLKRPR